MTDGLAIDWQVTGHPGVESEAGRAPKIDAPTCRFLLLNTMKGHDMAVSKRMRYEILRRDNHACRYCGASAPDVKLNVDHVIPTSLGGSDKPDNLATACADCNGGKTSSMPNAMTVKDVDQDTFHHAAELARTQPDMATVRAAFHAHLIAVWCWAWNSRSHTEPTEEQEGNAFEQLAILADGSDFTSEQLTQIAFDAGSARSTEAARFVAPQLSNEQFSLGADAVNLWWVGWETTNQGVGPSTDETAEFCDGLHALVILLDASAQRAMVMRAASRAGQRMDTNIVRHLSERTARP